MAKPTSTGSTKSRLRLAAIIVAVAVGVVAALAGAAYASVGTDQADYTPGSVVTISGGNDANGLPGYTQGHTVTVDTTADNGLWEQTCSDTVGVDGTWSCQVTLSSDPAVSVGSYTYTATSTNADGNPISETGTFTDASLITGSSTATVGVNGTYTSATSSGACNLTSFTWSVAKKPGSTTGAGSVASGQGTSSVQISFTEAGTVRISLDASGTLSSNGSACGATSQLDVDVAAPTNHAPVVYAGGSYSGNEGSAISLSSATATDQDSDTLTYAWSYAADPNYTNKAGASCSFSDSTALHPTITCNDNGHWILTLAVDDGHVASPVTDTATLAVSNVPPVIGTVTPADYSVYAKGATVSLSAPFTDAGTNDSHTCTIDWNYLSSTETGLVTETPGSGTGTCTASHAYTAAGIYTVAVTVTDNDNGADTAYLNVVVYDPDAGFVTGGGWIDSPAEAYTADPTLTGKATFGFVSKYQKGATIPTGNTEFVFHAAGMNFESTSYQWLVVAGSLAQFKGYGTINGSGNYGFLLRATDGSPDEFRIKIWEAADDTNIVYDNGSDQAIQGSIVIHTKK